MLLFNLMVANDTLCLSHGTRLFFSSQFFFFFSFFVFHMHGETLQNGQSWPGRKICTFSIFVLCTALLILNPIIYYLNPSIKDLLKRSLCVYVNNTKKVINSWKRQKKKKKKKVCGEKEHPFWCHGYSSRWLQKNLSPNHLFLWLCHSSLECH